MKKLLDLTGIVNEETKISKKPRRNRMNETALKRIKVRKINENSKRFVKRRRQINESDVTILGQEVPIEIYNELKKMSSTFVIVSARTEKKKCVFSLKRDSIDGSNLKKLIAMPSLQEIGVVNGKLTITLKY